MALPASLPANIDQGHRLTQQAANASTPLGPQQVQMIPPACTRASLHHCQCSC